jgi:hypothetical protein
MVVLTVVDGDRGDWDYKVFSSLFFRCSGAGSAFSECLHCWVCLSRPFPASKSSQFVVVVNMYFYMKCIYLYLY